MAPPKQRMALEQYVKIIEWLKENRHRIQREECTQLEAASQAGSVLGFVVPLTSMQKCAKIAEIHWAKSPPKPLPVPIDSEAIIILIAAIEGLYIETGRTPPTSLANLKTAYVQNQQSVGNEDDIQEPILDTNIK